MLQQYILIMVLMVITTEPYTSPFPPPKNSAPPPQPNITQPCVTTTKVARNVFFVFLMTCIFIIAFVGNILAITVISTSKKLQAFPSNILIASLAVADLGVALFIIPFRLDNYLYDQNFCFNIHVCRMWNITDSIFHVGSVTHLYVIAIERFIAITKPFFHQRVMSKNVTYICVLLIWIYSLIWAGLGSFNWEDPSKKSMVLNEGYGRRVCVNRNAYFYTTVYSVTYIIPLGIMGVLYAIILKTALKQVRAIASLNPEYLKNKNGGKAVNRNKQEMRVTKTLGIVYGAFLICWLPVSIITLTSWWCQSCYLKFRMEHKTLFTIVVALFVEILPTINSCLNPFVYILFNKQFRVAFKNFIMKILRKQRYYNESVTNESTTNHQPSSSKKGTSQQRPAAQVYEMSEQDK